MTGLKLTKTHLEKFEEHLLKEEKSRATVEKYLRDARAFVLYAEGKELTKSLSVGFKKSLEDAGYKPRSINSMIASLNGFLSFLERSECKVNNPQKNNLQRKPYRDNFCERF
jgi:site-specific recombinase XerD